MISKKFKYEYLGLLLLIGLYFAFTTLNKDIYGGILTLSTYSVILFFGAIIIAKILSVFVRLAYKKILPIRS